MAALGYRKEKVVVTASPATAEAAMNQPASARRAAPATKAPTVSPAAIARRRSTRGPVVDAASSRRAALLAVTSPAPGSGWWAPKRRGDPGPALPPDRTPPGAPGNGWRRRWLLREPPPG